MKNLYLTLLFFALNFALYAQVDYSFLSDGKQWVQETFISDGSNPDSLFYQEFTLGNDSIISGEQYTSVIRDTAHLEGLMQEVDGRLIIMREGIFDTLLDFNLEIGDTTVLDYDNFENPEFSQHMVLLSIDSVEVLDGSTRKRLNFELNNVGFEGSGFAVSWIDGLGSTRGTIFNKWCAVRSRSRSSPICLSKLICVKDNSERILYNNTEDEIYDCNKAGIVSSSDNYQLPNGAFRLFPNPAKDFVFIEGSYRYPVSRLILTDMGGRRILDQTLASPMAEAHRTAINGFAEGIYNLTVFTPRGEWTLLRLVVK